MKAVIRSRRFLGILFVAAVCAAFAVEAAAPMKITRDAAMKLVRDGNHKEAFDAFRARALSADTPPAEAAQDISGAVNALQNLGRIQEADALLEDFLKVQSNDWRTLQAAAQAYRRLPPYGAIINGKFIRQGGHPIHNAHDRDRVRALQLMQQAMPLVNKEPGPVAAGFYLTLADMMIEGTQNESWRLQTLTKLDAIPDYEEGYNRFREHSYAPVTADGTPVFYEPAKDWTNAANDGERWRWALAEAAERNPTLQGETLWRRAQFLETQFGVQTLREYSWWFARRDPQDSKDSIFALHTLKDDETIARLATGIKRLTLPDEHNHIKLFQRIADDARGSYTLNAIDALSRNYQDRRQFPRAAEYVRERIRRSPTDAHKQLLAQIVDPWGRLEPAPIQPAKTQATFSFRFRNGKRVTFTATKVEIDKLLEDVKAYLKSNPKNLDWAKFNIEQLGHRLVVEGQKKYLGEKAAEWSVDLEPPADHFDSRIEVASPLQTAGAYLITAKMDGGNEHHVVQWIADTALISKQQHEKTLYFAADAVTGEPIDKATVELFGYRQVNRGRNQFRVETRNFAEFTDAQGMVAIDANRFRAKDSDQAFTYFTTARTKTGRLAILGFDSMWWGQVVQQPGIPVPYFGLPPTIVRAFTITDRPAYRPKQTVEFKTWIRQASYGEESSAAQWAKKPFTIQINNPKGDKVYEKMLTSDEFGGVADRFEIPSDATLGVYNLSVVNYGGLSFRVEEYKKPEFEVTVKAPEKPVKLGDKITATISAKYYFGSPVTNAKVAYKVYRTKHDTHWYPPRPWDWLFGPGYWWFGQDYTWYPGWGRWGCIRPPFPGGWEGPPELVASDTVSIGEKGEVKVEIDTAAALAMHGDSDHSYRIVAEVTDQSRRVITGEGSVIAAREPFKVFVWSDTGYARSGDTIDAFAAARTPDGNPVAGTAKITLFKVRYDAEGKPTETKVEEWPVKADADGKMTQRFVAADAGQYRIAFNFTSAEGQTGEGAQLFTVIGQGATPANFRFEALELVADKTEYKPGDRVKLLINTNRPDSTVLLFARPQDGQYPKPRFIRVTGKSVTEEIEVVGADMPNFFIEAITISDGQVHTQTREIVVPPEKRILNVKLEPSKTEFLPGEAGDLKLTLTDLAGKPFVGSTVMAIYDKSVEYISGGSNVPDLREFFWSWKRNHYAQTRSSLGGVEHPISVHNSFVMNDLGIFGDQVAMNGMGGGGFGGGTRNQRFAVGFPTESDGMVMSAAPMSEAREGVGAMMKSGAAKDDGPAVTPTIRSEFADTVLWVAALTTDADGVATAKFKMPDDLTTWKIRSWAMGPNVEVGEASAEVITRKNIIIRMQTPRFLVDRDEAVFTANVHNYLKAAKRVEVVLELEGDRLELLEDASRVVEIAAGGEAQINWRVRATREGEATVRMKALTDEESDAVEQKLPVNVHGMLKLDSVAGAIRPDKTRGEFTFRVPEKRRPEQTRLEIRYSPTLAGAMVDALPYLAEYPYGCTEQTLNRFLPAVITRNVLHEMGLDLKAIRDKRTNLNAQQLGDPAERAKQWKQFNRNPVFDEAEFTKMVKTGVEALVEMQLSDGGWGWFSGFGEYSSPHTTAVVVHGLMLAQQNDVAIPNGVIERGVAWLKNYQDSELQKLRNAPSKTEPYKTAADNTDALVYMLLVDADKNDPAMGDLLFRDREHLSLYSKAMFGLALEKTKQQEQLTMILRNLSQYVVQDEENQTAFLKLSNESYWWNWYGDDIEAMSAYLKLLSCTDPKSEVAARMAKYLVNNRKHGFYWKSTRDTAAVIEALAEFMRKSGENKPDVNVEIWIDGVKKHTAHVTKDNLFTFDASFVLEGDAVTSGEHKIEIKKSGDGPLYYNGYLTTFTLEDDIPAAGLEVKVARHAWKLTPKEATDARPGSRGQALSEQIEKYDRERMDNSTKLASGDLVEIELEIDSKNDYEYVMFEDFKAAGCEAVDVRSGYTGNSLGAYVELRDNRVSLFVRSLPRGKHKLTYRLRAETPGDFSALPAVAQAMYAPELRGNSTELKVHIGEMK